MSPRAAWRLERLGFGPVYDYVAGKADWLAAGLPTVRADPSERRAVDVLEPYPPTCAPDTPVRDLPRGASVVVVNDERIVLGRVRAAAIAAADASALAEHVMVPGPATVRASEPLEPLLQRMADRKVDEVLVTTPEGRLLGVIRAPQGGG
jgi:CBS domain-containing protein